LDKETTILKIDEIIEILSESKKPLKILTPDEVKAIQGVDKEDHSKLADRLEDLVVLLRADPDNKRKIHDTRQVAFDEFGHISPVWDVLKSVEKLF
jgi:predicted transcriptional regulator of viral defense system